MMSPEQIKLLEEVDGVWKILQTLDPLEIYSIFPSISTQSKNYTFIKEYIVDYLQQPEPIIKNDPKAFACFLIHWFVHFIRPHMQATEFTENSAWQLGKAKWQQSLEIALKNTVDQPNETKLVFVKIKVQTELEDELLKEKMIKNYKANYSAVCQMLVKLDEQFFLSDEDLASLGCNEIEFRKELLSTLIEEYEDLAPSENINQLKEHFHAQDYAKIIDFTHAEMAAIQ